MEYKQAYDVMFQWNTLTEFLQCVSCHLFLKVTLTVPVKYYTVKIYTIRVAILPLFSLSWSKFFYFGRLAALNKGVLAM